ncbi:MAG: hypothetical protein KA249_11965, partial [Dermatophilaceae bacterium]|nr:hypothetical protein [Dermatophilaceae bacterium]
WPAGETTPANLGGLCRRHHRLKQRGRWRYTLTPDGTVEWVSPSGKKRITHADHTIWPPPQPKPRNQDRGPANHRELLLQPLGDSAPPVSAPPIDWGEPPF